MKAIIDAINEIKVYLTPSILTNTDVPYLFKEIKNGKYWLSSAKISSSDYVGEIEYICTVYEFNACVGELSAANWIDGISIEQWKDGMKNTVIDSHGNELEIGKVYEFSDDGVKWFVDFLLAVRLAKDFEYTSGRDSHWKKIKACQSPLGTIKKAPVKLVDGKAYQFEHNGYTFIGIYSGESKVMQDNHAAYKIANCKDIVLLVPEAK